MQITNDQIISLKYHFDTNHMAKLIYLAMFLKMEQIGNHFCVVIEKSRLRDEIGTHSITLDRQLEIIESTKLVKFVKIQKNPKLIQQVRGFHYAVFLNILFTKKSRPARCCARRAGEQHAPVRISHQTGSE